MKQLRLLFVVLVAVAMACSKSDSPPALESAKVTTTTVQAPSGLTTAASTNTHAATVADYITSINAMSNWSGMFAVPASGAAKSSTVIKASNGRVNTTASTTVTYTWTDAQSGTSVAYQITDDGTSYLWEYFIKLSATSDWLKYLDANEKKDGSSGTLRVFDATGSDPKVVEIKYEWTKTGDQFTFKMTTDTDYLVLNMSVSTKAGTLDFYESGIISAKYTWGIDGHGTWQMFDSQGTISSSGTW